MGKLAVLGCGPSGLVAAHAAHLLGWDVELFAKHVKPSDLYGCQYLHAPVPGVPESVTGPGWKVEYRLDGSATQYKEKVYGPDYRGTVSPEDLIGEHYAWDLRATYRWLWSRWSGNIWEMDVHDEVRMKYLRNHSDKIISTVPARALCTDLSHSFTAQDVWAMGDVNENGDRVPVEVPNMTVICSGMPEVSWYRAAKVYGYTTVEWPDNRKPPIPGISKVMKPLATNCDCQPHIERFGRYGAWQKGTLVSDVYTQVTEALA